MPAIRPIPLSRNNPAGQGPQQGEYPELGHPGDYQAEAGGTLRYIRRWVINTFGSKHDPGQTFYNPAGLRTESGGHPTDVPVNNARQFLLDTFARTFGQFAQSFPNGGYERVSSGNRYFPWVLQLRPAPEPLWQDWSKTQQVAIMTSGVQPQMTTPSFPLLTTQGPTSSYGSLTTTLPADPGVYDESVYG